MYKLLSWEASLFPINIAEDRTKGSGPLFCVSSLGSTVGGLRLISPLLLVQRYQTQFQPQSHFSVSRASSSIKMRASLDTGNVLNNPRKEEILERGYDSGKKRSSRS